MERAWFLLCNGINIEWYHLAISEDIKLSLRQHGLSEDLTINVFQW